MVGLKTARQAINKTVNGFSHKRFLAKSLLLLPSAIALFFVLLAVQGLLLYDHWDSLHYAHWRAKRVLPSTFAPWILAVGMLWLGTMSVICRQPRLDRKGARGLTGLAFAIMVFFILTVRVVFSQGMRD